jgi:hypothetical protein
VYRTCTYDYSMPQAILETYTGLLAYSDSKEREAENLVSTSGPCKIIMILLYNKIIFLRLKSPH